jgi:hypothetical protein
MTRISKLALIAAVTAVIATPVFAQSFDPEVGTGNVLSFSTPSAVQNGKVAARHTSQGKIAARVRHQFQQPCAYRRWVRRLQPDAVAVLRRHRGRASVRPLIFSHGYSRSELKKTSRNWE